jgi:SEC-C motif domain protein
VGVAKIRSAPLNSSAEYSENGERIKHHELAQFKNENGTWFFWDGGPPKPKQFIRQAPKTGRNDPCPCGSGKKFKKCCG